VRILALVLALGACGHGGSSADPPPQRRDGGALAKDAALELPARPLGLGSLDEFRWRKRSGQAAFRLARKAEDREDWPGVVAAAHDALAADPGHLEAAWLYAVALAKTGKLGEVLAPLSVAAAGDLGKWGHAALEQPALQPWLATPTGEAWKRRLDQDRQAYAAALARALLVTADGDLFAFDPEGGRWYRLTRTYGAVAAVFASGKDLAYVTRARKKGGKLAVGLVDLGRGRSTRPTEVATAPPLAIAFSAAKPTGFWIGTGATWRQLDDDGKLHALPAKTARPTGPWLDVLAHSARLHRLPIANVSADWDDQSLASALRLGTSNRVVSVPSPGLIDGNTAAWSPDRAHLAFVAVDDHCTPGAAAAAAYVVDAATGTARELERGTALAIEWRDDRHLAVAGDRGVSIVELGGGASTLDGADGLVTPRRKPRCTPEPVDEPVSGDEEPEN
jgi:hypothetical protein